MAITLFDFDSTLTFRDTMRPFAVYSARRYHCRWKIAVLYLLLCALKAGCISDSYFKETYLKFFFAGRSDQEVYAAAQDFFKINLVGEHFLRPRVMERLRAHLAAGDDVYLVSANFDFFLAPLIRLWQLKGIIATKAESRGEVLTGRIEGVPCKGAEKCARTRAIIGEEALRNATVYGDSEDAPLMSAAGRSFFADTI